MGQAEILFHRFQSEGKNFLEELILEGESEGLYLDFKQSSDQGVSKNLHDNDKNNLAKAISGFANSEGGVIVWGIVCKPDSEGNDVPSDYSLIKNPKKFSSNILKNIGRATLPVINIIENCVILGFSEDDDGIVVTYVPRSNIAPVQSLRDEKFYIRVGTEFKPAPYGVLSSLFGKRPEPSCMLNLVPSKISIDDNGIANLNTELFIKNDGPRPLKNSWLQIEIRAFPGGIRKISVTDRNGSLQETHPTGGRFPSSYVLRPDREDDIVPLQSYFLGDLAMCFDSKPESSIEISFNYGCEDSYVRQEEVNVSSNFVEWNWDNIILRYSGAFKDLDSEMKNEYKSDFKEWLQKIFPSWMANYRS